MLTPEALDAMSTLDELCEKLRGRQTEIQTLDSAYRGDFKLHYASTDFREFFAGRYKDFSDNWCEIVAGAPHERLAVTGIQLSGEKEGDSDLWDVWRENDADAYSDLAFLDAIIAKRAFALVWGDPVRITWEHPSQAIVGYDPETRQRVAGAKIWCEDETEYGTLYLPDSVWKFARPRVSEGQTESGLHVASSYGGWQPRQAKGDDTWPIANPMGVVPLVEFQNRPRLIGEPMSDISGTLSMQHAINLIWAQLFLAVDNASWPQKVITGAEMPTIPVLDADGNSAGDKPVDLKKFMMDRALWLENPETKISEWSAVNLEAYTKVIEIAVGHIGAQTRTPSHYFSMGGTIANISADAMKALETGLVKRTAEKTEHFGRATREVFRLVALAQGNDEKAKALSRAKTTWKDIEIRSDAQLADAAGKDRQMVGLPLRFVLRTRYNLSDPDIDEVLQMIKDEAADPVLAAALKDLAGGNTGEQDKPEQTKPVTEE